MRYETTETNQSLAVVVCFLLHGNKSFVFQSKGQQIQATAIIGSLGAWRCCHCGRRRSRNHSWNVLGRRSSSRIGRRWRNGSDRCLLNNRRQCHRCSRRLCSGCLGRCIGSLSSTRRDFPQIQQAFRFISKKRRMGIHVCFRSPSNFGKAILRLVMQER